MNELLYERAEGDPLGVTYTFLDAFSGRRATRAQSLTNSELLLRARALAAQIQSVALRGDRVLVLNQPGLDYVVGVYACMLAGVVAVPAYPPEKTRLSRGVERVRAIMQDARPCCVLADGEAAEATQGAVTGHLEWINSAEWDTADAARHVLPDMSSDDIAVLQYTSGSTGRPKGVMLSHGNLLHNLRAGCDAYGIAGRMDGVFWLPPYHDMGLIGGLLMALYCGGRTRLLAPLSFIRDPLRWVQAMSDYGSFVSAAPDFAYDLCARAAAAVPEEVAELDLSNWHVAISGAEPVRADTVRRFAEAFAPAGFRQSAFRPSFGLAENTLLVTAPTEGVSLVALDAAELEQNRVVEATSGAVVRDVVGCGTSADPAQRVVIVDPQTRVRCPQGIVGEIWVNGPSTAGGYWGDAAESTATFGAMTDDGEGPFLRTGDLGFTREAELFVTGRLKDLIIIRGRNHYPQDLERTVEGAHPRSLRSGHCVAFSVDDGTEERLVLAVEAAAKSSEADRRSTAEAIRTRIGEQHDVAVSEIVFVPRGGIRRTSSGKLRRSAVRISYLAGEYPPEKRFPRPYMPPRDAVERAVADAWGRVLGIGAVGVHDRFFELGGDSLKAVQLLGHLQASDGYELTLEEVAEAKTVESVAEVIRRRETAVRPAAEEVRIDLG
ncbi:AMP-binding protein [Streptomyces alkaliterrae]|uniref:AMP-binding protein n=1 Tax=Streptomyces alkaliterrae TaxID=2213162 RepID=A0A5P0YMY6_9ACTN|nr:AMP-binding protein [Streptomyces alkaliterrae]MBB1259194.1 AMP-binding protein [Streptomyces alkaliterrae]MQS00782.1 AMP-binding protein [Streptomyces alkaliterrae]